MTQILRQSTAADVLIGPFVDLTDGATAEEGESPAVYLSKNGQALAAKNDVTTPVHDDAGYYNCELDATDTNTVGTLVLIVEKSANALPVRHEFQVVEEAVYDQLLAGSAPGAATVAALATVDGIVDAILVDTAEIGAAGAGLTAVPWNSAWDAEAQSEAADALAAYDPPTKAELDAGLAALNDPTAAAIADAVWEEDVTDHSGTADSTAEALVAAASATIAGPGALEKTIGITAGGSPVEGASVWVSTDSAGSNVIAGPLTTDSNGVVTILVDAGTFYVWMQKDGFDPILGQSITVS